MNKSMIAWVVAGLGIFGCLVFTVATVIVGYLYYDTNTKLTTTTGQLEQTTSQLNKTTADLSTANKKVTDLTSQLSTATTSLATLQAKYDGTMCKETVTVDYSSPSTILNSLIDFVKGLPEGYLINNKTSGYLSLALWEGFGMGIVNYTESGTAASMVFFVHSDSNTIFWGNKNCWLQSPSQ